MKQKKFNLIAGVVMMALAFSFPAAGFAATVTFSADTTLTLPNNLSVTILDGGLVDGLVVNDDSTVTLTVGSDTAISFRSTDRYTFVASQGATSNLGTVNCFSGQYSQIDISASPTGSVILNINSATACDSAQSGGGGSALTGGGGSSSTPTPASTTTPDPDPVETTGTVTPENGGSLVSDNGNVTVSVPSGATTANGTLSIAQASSFTAPSNNQKVVGQVYDVNLTDNGTAITSFSEPVSLTFSYSDAEIASVEESSLKVYYWNVSQEKWIVLSSVLDISTNTVTATTDHFTQFAILGDIKSGGSLIKLQCDNNSSLDDPCRSVYYLGTDEKRYVFPNQKTYETWYSDFSSVEIIDSATLASYQIGGSVTYRPGTRMIKIQSDPKVYAISEGGVLRWVSTEALAIDLYGVNWNQKVDDLSSAFFTNYTLGADITSEAGFAPDLAQQASPNISTDKGL